MTIEDLKRASPFPWRYMIGPKGQIAVVDSVGKQVPLLTLLDFVCAVTRNNSDPVKPNP